MKFFRAIVPTVFLALLVILAHGCGRKCERWTTPLDREDMRSCNAARAGNIDLAEDRFELCMKSMGYRLEEVECKK